MKNDLMKNFIIIFFTLGLLTGCSVQKRHYTKGYYVSWKNKNTRGENKASLATISEKVLINSRNLVSNEGTISTYDASLLVSADKNTKDLFIPAAPHKFLIPPDSCGDKIVFKNGEEILAKIEEVSSSRISYRPCDHLDGPLRVVGTESLFMIRYANGTKEVFKTEAKPVNAAPSKTKPLVKKKNGFAKTCYILSFFSWYYLIPAIVSIVFGFIALNQINRNPEKYTNRWQAVTGLVISFAVIALAIALFIIFA